MTALDIVTFILLIIIIIISLILQYMREKNNKINTIESKIDQFCNRYVKEIWVFFAILLFITVIYKFGKLPIYMGVDEAGMAYDSYCIANYGVDRYLNSYPLYLTNFGSGQSALCAYISVIFIKILGANIISYRMPVLIIYLLGLIASYFFVSKTKDKKTAVLFCFLIITCPWNIINARQALDCNLYAGMLMIDIFLMNRANKYYQYTFAGIAIGLTLYTYCLSWISMPIFLFVWIMYMLYLKKMNLKKLISLGIPIAILAMPLIYFLLLNYGIVDQTQIGIFTLPILREFRGEQIAISNIWKTGLESIHTIFLGKNTIYFCYILLFIIGYVVSIKETIQHVKEKKYSTTTIMVIAFTTILIGLLMTRIPTANKANVLYIPILYFVTIAILKIGNNSRILLTMIVLIIFCLFINFEHYYYTEYSLITESPWYEDSELIEVTRAIEKEENNKNINKHIMTHKAAQFIYPLLENKISPYEFNKESETKRYGQFAQETTRVGNYYYYSYYYDQDSIKKIEFSDKDGIFVISKSFQTIAKFIENKGYHKQEYGRLYIFTKEGVNINF